MNRLSLLFCGDFSPVRRFEDVVPREGSAVFGDLQEKVCDSDISFLNLEAPLSTRGAPIPKNGKRGKPGLRGHPDSIRAVAEAGFNVVSLANNHTMDWGEEAMADTLALCESHGLATCGAGPTLEAAQQPRVIEKSGLRVAFVAVSEHQFGIAGEQAAGVAPLDPVDNLAQLETAKSLADLVFVSIHGGNEFFPFPRPGLRKICRFFIDRGADGVICHHSHVPGVYERYKGKPISYGLGNLLFDHETPPAGWNEGYALRLEYALPDLELTAQEIIPYTQNLEQGGVRCMQGALKESFLGKLEDNCEILNDAQAYQAKWDEFCDSSSAFLVLRNYAPFWFSFLPRLDRYTSLHRLFLPSNTLHYKTNIARCESHHELLVAVLSRKWKKL